MKPYPQYKDSGIEWLGQIPEHWGVRPLKFSLKFLNHRRIPLSSEERGAMVQKIFPYYGASGIIDHVDSYIFDKPLILIAEDGANLLSRSTPLAFIADGKYWVNNHAHILEPTLGPFDYWSNLLCEIDYSPWISGSAQPKLTKERLGNLQLPVPPLPEQQAIARFLDEKTEQIDALIAKKERLLQLLAEKRTALITRAVTKGLNADAPMKDSGIPWLGVIPAHWEVKKLKYVASYNDESLPENLDPEFLINYVDISSVSLIEGIKSIEQYEFAKAPSRARRIVRDGDTIISTVRTYLKSISAIKEPIENLIVSTGFAVIRPIGVDPDYLSFFLQNEGFVGAVVANSVGVSYPAINASDLMNLFAAIPPVEEQKLIASCLTKNLVEINQLDSKTVEAISKLKEYRASLITHAVTGKIDVREHIPQTAVL